MIPFHLLCNCTTQHSGASDRYITQFRKLHFRQSLYHLLYPLAFGPPQVEQASGPMQITQCCFR